MPVYTTEKKCPECGGVVLKDEYGLYCASEDMKCIWNDTKTWKPTGKKE